MPNTKKSLEKKYPDYNAKLINLQFNKFNTMMGTQIRNKLGQEAYNQFINESEQINEYIIPAHLEMIQGLEFTDIVLNEQGCKKAKDFFKKWTEKLDAGLENNTGKFASYNKDETYVSNPENGDLVRAILDNPPICVLLLGFGNGFKTTKVQKVAVPGKPGVFQDEITDNSSEVINGMGEDLFNSLNNYYHGLRKIIEVQYKRQKDIDNHLGEMNEKKFLEEYKQALLQTVNAYEETVRLHKSKLDDNGNPKEFADFLQNPLSEITDVNPGEMRAHNSSAIAGLKAQIRAIDLGWGADETGIFGFLGETEREIEIEKIKLARAKSAMESMEEGPQKQKNQRDIEKNEKSLSLLEEEYKKLREECWDVDVKGRRDLKIEITSKIKDFAERHRREAGIFDATGKQNYYTSAHMTADNVLNPYEMSGLNKADQLKGIMDDLDDVDGTFQKSSENFKTLRKRLEELNALAKKYRGEMNREQMDEYLKKADEVKAARDTYLAGKKREEDLYAASHNGEKPERKPITTKRIGFAMGLEKRLNIHLENATSRFKEDVSCNPEEHAMALLSRRMRSEENYRNANVPSKSINQNHEFVKSVYRSLYLEQVYTRLRLEDDFTAEDMEMELSPKKIEAGAERLQQTFDDLGLSEHILNDINLRIKVKSNDFGFGKEFIQTELKQEMLYAFRDNKAGTGALINSFGFYDMQPEFDDIPDPDESYGFGRHFPEYYDKDPVTGVSRLAELESKLGIREEDTLTAYDKQKKENVTDLKKEDYKLIFTKDGYMEKLHDYLKHTLGDQADYTEDGHIEIKQGELEKVDNTLVELTNTYNAVLNLEYQKLLNDHFDKWTEANSKQFSDQYRFNFGSLPGYIGSWMLKEFENNGAASQETIQLKDVVTARKDSLHGGMSIDELFSVSGRKLTENEKLLLKIEEEEVNEPNLRRYTFQYGLNEYKASFGDHIVPDEEKDRLMEKAMSEFADDMDLSGMTGKELKEFLPIFGKSDTFRDFLANASAAADAALKRPLDDAAKLKANEYKNYVEDRKARQDAIKAEKEFKEKNVNLESVQPIKPGEEPEEVLKHMIRKEEIKRSDLIKDLKNNENSMQTKKQIVSSACRSLYMEMLKQKYPTNPVLLDENQVEENNANLRKALALGFRDKRNAETFTKILSTQGFSEHFQTELFEIATKKGSLSHQDIIQARDHALIKALSEAVPEFKTDNDGKIISPELKVEKDGKHIKPENKAEALEVAEREISYIKIENLRRVDIALKSNVLNVPNISKLPWMKNNPNFKNFEFVTDYNVANKVNKGPQAGPHM